MKKAFILALAVASFPIMMACSGENKTSEGSEPEATLSETGVGVESTTESEEAAAGETIEASALDFESADRGAVKVLKNDKLYRPGFKYQRLTILDFNATWCGPCKQFAPVFDSVAEKFVGKVDFVSIDTDNNPLTANAFGIEAIPTVIFIYPDGKTKSYVGTQDLLPESRFESLVNAAL